MSCESHIEPKVGMGATKTSGSDAYPFTIIDVITPKKIIVRADKYTYDKVINDYHYSPDPNGTTYVVTRRKDGNWRMMNGSSLFYIGNRLYHYDPSF